MTVHSFVAAVLAMAIAGCSGASPESVGFGAVQLMAAPLVTVTSQSGQLTVDVRTSPQPPARGTNAVLLTITGATDGVARDALEIDVKPWMPAMGHGTSIVPTVVPQTNGTYLITNVDLYMAGLWQLRLTISGSTEDNASPAFEIQ
jgi:hypothetical protein